MCIARGRQAVDSRDTRTIIILTTRLFIMTTHLNSGNLLGWLDRLSMRWQIGIYTVTLLLLSIAGFAYFAFEQSREIVTNVTLNQMATETDRAAEVIERSLATAGSIAVQVRDFPPIPGIFRSQDNAGVDPVQTGSTTELWIERLVTIVTSQMKAHAEYQSAVLLDAQGTPIIRISRSLNGRIETDQEALLTDVERNEFEATILLRKGSIYVSPLQTEGTSSVFAVATPYFDPSGKARGTFGFILSAPVMFQDAASMVKSGELDIVDQAGRYVFSESHQDNVTAGRMYNDDKPVRGRILLEKDGPISYRALIPGSHRPDGVAVIATYRKIYYASHAPDQWLAVAPSLLADTVLEPVHELSIRFVGIGLLTVLVAVCVIWWFSKRVSAALKLLANTADRVANGETSAVIPEIPGVGEVRTLADSIRTMTGNLLRIAEEAESQQRRTRAILNSTADGIITLDEAGSIRAINQLASEMFGFDAETLIGHDAGRLVPVLTNSDANRDDTPISPGEVRSLGPEAEVTGRHRSGREIPLALRVTQMEHMGERLFIATVQDITSRKIAEAERTRLLDGIRDAVNHLSAASHEILATTAEQARSAQEQASSVTETAATVEELTRTAEQARGRAEEVAQSARKADEVSQSGKDAVSRTFAAMEQVREQVESTAESILALAERAQAISKIIVSVDDLADQTNLLAINASIEAARAGEYGKGFAVVATEIKTLAEQSKKATNQVREILGDIQRATNTAVISTEQGTRTVEEARQVVKRAEETINQLTATIGVAARSASQIVASSGQQASAMQQINEAMSHIDQATRQTLAATRQAEQSASDLNDLGQRLHDLIATNEQA